MLRCLGGNSPYLSALVLREPDALRRLTVDGPEAAFTHTLSNLMHVSASARRPDIAAALRQAKRSAALIVA
ncbi:MAG: [glutamine synthetase] adenylyltransferase / [glutamine synthetase]-adenylyl-L-tyrosine, partial [Acetobacteraceae bacterium]|nr:[glutamine synthetase] adenylyltransferase / [glutamine synthetase]-adenylyl-L-tyrosine [Acetobacteraceae bacterium]